MLPCIYLYSGQPLFNMRMIHGDGNLGVLVKQFNKTAELKALVSDQAEV